MSFPDEETRYVVPLTEKMVAKLDWLYARYTREPVRVVSFYDGLPVLRFPSGKQAALTTGGRLEWLQISK